MGAAPLIRVLTIGAALLLAGCGAEAACAPDSLGEVTVAAGDDADTLKLTDGRFLRLTGIQAPKSRPDIPGFADWPLAREAAAALNALAPPGTLLALRSGGAREDRYGRALAQAYATRDGQEVWLQGAMVEQGFARAYSFADNHACSAELLARERSARAAKRGIWADPFYAIRTPEAVAADRDTFQIVEGRVTEARDVRGRYFLNFGADYRTDFTVTIAPEDRAAFSRAPFRLEDLQGKTLRVRGWIAERNGPQIEATHPEQIEVAD